MSISLDSPRGASPHDPVIRVEPQQVEWEGHKVTNGTGVLVSGYAPHDLAITIFREVEPKTSFFKQLKAQAN